MAGRKQQQHHSDDGPQLGRLAGRRWRLSGCCSQSALLTRCSPARSSPSRTSLAPSERLVHRPASPFLGCSLSRRLESQQSNQADEQTASQLGRLPSACRAIALRCVRNNGNSSSGRNGPGRSSRSDGPALCCSSFLSL